jgi:hypothetical protein
MKKLYYGEIKYRSYCDAARLIRAQQHCKLAIVDRVDEGRT